MAGSAGAVLVVGGAAGYYALTNEGGAPATQKVTTAVTQSSLKSSTPTTQVPLSGNSGQDLPENIGLRMQYQETSEWCWIAVATSINHFYNPASTVTQCELRTAVGHMIGGFPGNACPAATAIANVPGLAAKLADPYAKTALYALDNPGLVLPYRDNHPGNVADALKVNGNLNLTEPSIALTRIVSEISAGRPIAVDIKWNQGGQHCVAIAGVLNDMLLICDPIRGESVIHYESFPSAYQSGASLMAVCLTKKGPDEA